jgi:hypothetical protein
LEVLGLKGIVEFIGVSLSDLLTALGLLLTLIGAGVAARAVILKPEDAANIGVSRFGSEDWREELKQPMVQNLLKSSRAAKLGLILVAVGTLLQLLPVVCRLFMLHL